MTEKKLRWSADEKVRIVLQTFKDPPGVAEICRQNNLAPRTIYTWKEAFLAGGRSAFEGKDAATTNKRHRKEVADLKRLVGEYAVANAALKNDGGRDRVSTMEMIQDVMGLNRALKLCSVSSAHGTIRPKSARSSRIPQWWRPCRMWQKCAQPTVPAAWQPSWQGIWECP